MICSGAFRYRALALVTPRDLPPRRGPLSAFDFAAEAAAFHRPIIHGLWICRCWDRSICLPTWPTCVVADSVAPRRPRGFVYATQRAGPSEAMLAAASTTAAAAAESRNSLNVILVFGEGSLQRSLTDR